jgi:NAD(P)-dependent dehydrogenase (short-subunit alcohol dehydrogenase family)
MFDVNVLSGVRLARHYFPRMLARNWGRVIFISSDYGASTPPDMVDYGATKSALQAVSRGMAELTKGTNVTVNSVLPGATRSAGIMEYLRAVVGTPGMTDKEVETAFFRAQRPSSLIQRMLDASEVAHMVAFLASPLSSATNGAAVRVEGGTYRSIL